MQRCRELLVLFDDTRKCIFRIGQSALLGQLRGARKLARRVADGARDEDDAVGSLDPALPPCARGFALGSLAKNFHQCLDAALRTRKRAAKFIDKQVSEVLSAEFGCQAWSTDEEQNALHKTFVCFSADHSRLRT